MGHTAGFEYHGAEHKVIHTYEHGSDLTVEMLAPLDPSSTMRH